ncbi:MAG: ABC transporter substrate-binding protein [Rhizobiales bacterium]|nr:ABC transporter substrate-binding protein [Hyphomicrobiales bacterium]
MPGLVRAQNLDAIKMSLEFRIYGGNAPMFFAAENGIFKNLGLDVSSDGSSGSGESVTRVATGTHQFGLADASTLVEFAGRHPDAAPKIVMTVFDVFPAVIMSLKRKPVKSLKDLAGIKLGTGTADAGSKIMPALLALNKIDPASFNRITVDVKLRDTMLMKGDVDAVIAFDYTAIFNLLDNGMKMEDINLLYYKVALGTARAWIAADRDRKGAIAAVTKREKLLRPDIEERRMSWVLDRLIKTDEVKKNGLGYIDESRLTQGLKVLAEGFKMPKPLSVKDIYNGSFLAPAADRKFA